MSVIGYRSLVMNNEEQDEVSPTFTSLSDAPGQTGSPNDLT